MTFPFERNHTARAIKEVRKILNQGRSEPEPKDPYCTCSTCELVDHSPVDTDKLFSASMVGLSIALGALVIVFNCITPFIPSIKGEIKWNVQNKLMK